MVFDPARFTITSREMAIVDENSEWLGVSRQLLMENAGKAVANAVYRWIGTLRGVEVVVFCGVGNNGGDGMVAARHMASMGARVTVVLVGSPSSIKTSEARKNMEILKAMRESVSFIVAENVEELQKLRGQVQRAEAVVDAIFGTGVRGRIRDPWRTAIEMINSSRGFKLAVDIPSGVNPDTGEVEDIAVVADMTVTFHKVKRGIPPAAPYCGEVVVESIGIPPEAELVMGPGDLKDAMLDLAPEAKTVALISPKDSMTDHLERLGVSYKVNSIDGEVVYLGESREIPTRSRRILVSEGVREGSEVSLIRVEDRLEGRTTEICGRAREIALETGGTVYIESGVDAVSDGDRCKVAWHNRPLGPVASSALRAAVLFFLARGLDPFRACCAAGYVAGCVEEKGVGELESMLRAKGK